MLPRLSLKKLHQSGKFLLHGNCRHSQLTFSGRGTLMKRLLAAAAAACALAAFPCPLQAAEAVRQRATVPWTEPVMAMEFMHVTGGEFLMGSPETNPDESPPHSVRIRSFYLARVELLQRQWEKVMGTNPSRFAPCPECPVEQVSWEDVQEFLQRAGTLTGLALRLPTEAEWEYAAGGGAEHQAWPGTNSASETGEFAWYSGSFSGKTRSSAGKIPNLFGIHDMAGNVAEWCSDWYGADYYSRSPGDNPGGPASGTRRVVRGGSWLSGPRDIRVARRSRRSPDTRSPSLGFRLAFDMPQESAPLKTLDKDPPIE
jgi:formylglycine-generating enzyme required for sulfatase activity